MSNADDIFSRNPAFKNENSPFVTEILQREILAPVDLTTPPSQEELIAENLGDMALTDYGIEPTTPKRRLP